MRIAISTQHCFNFYESPEIINLTRHLKIHSLYVKYCLQSTSVEVKLSDIKILSVKNLREMNTFNELNKGEIFLWRKLCKV